MMSRKRKPAAADLTADDEPAALPEKFEDFEQAMTEPVKPFRRRHEPEDMPDPVVQVVKPMGGMVETTWSGLRMWTCPRCRGTTFSEDDSKVHVCKTPRGVDQADE